MSANVSTLKKPYQIDNFFTVNLKNPDTYKKDITLKSMVQKVKPNDKVKNVVLVNNNDEKLITVKIIGESEIKIEASPLINDDLKVFAQIALRFNAAPSKN